jgi:hypothetical protein
MMCAIWMTTHCDERSSPLRTCVAIGSNQYERLSQEVNASLP